MQTPFGLRRVTYADYTASGRSLTFIEDYIRSQVLPLYANTHTETSGTGLQTTRFREEAREIIRNAVGATKDEHAVIFAGSGHDRSHRQADHDASRSGSPEPSTMPTTSSTRYRQTSGQWSSSVHTSIIPTSCPGGSPSPTS